jgi:hypothetical protein
LSHTHISSNIHPVVVLEIEVVAIAIVTKETREESWNVSITNYRAAAFDTKQSQEKPQNVIIYISSIEQQHHHYGIAIG